MANKDNVILQLVKETDVILDTSEELLFTDIDKIQKRINDRLSKFVGGLNTTGGRFKSDQDLVSALNAMEANIADELTGQYKKNAVNYLDNFKQIDQLSNEMHSKVNDLTVAKRLNPFREELVKKVVNDLSGSGMNSAFIQPAKDILANHVLLGATVTDAQKSLEDYLLGSKGKKGGLERYISQIARDGISQYNGAVNQKIATEFNIDAYRYVGSIIEDSRHQCREWIKDGIIKIKDLPKDLADERNTGQIEGTNVSNFAQYRGGYNCRHQAIPVRSKVAAAINKEVLSKPTEARIAKEESVLEPNLGLSVKKTILKGDKKTLETKGKLRLMSPTAKKKASDLKKFENVDTDFVDDYTLKPKANVKVADNLEDALKNEEEWIKTLTANEKDAIQTYTRDAYIDINGYLRGRVGFENVPTDAGFNNFFEFLDVLDNALDNAPKINTKTYRGLRFNNFTEYRKYLNSMNKNGGVYVEKGYSSSSFNKIGRFSDGEWSIKVEIKGKNGVLVEKSSAMFGNDDFEVLFKKGTNFRVDSVEELHQNQSIIKLTEL